jgi:hypothetical protein
MVFKILIGLSALVGVFLFRRTIGGLWRMALVLMIAGIAMTVAPLPAAFASGFWLYVIGLVMVLVAASLATEMHVAWRTFLLSMATLLAMTHVFQLLHWPGVMWLGYALSLPLVGFVAIVIPRRAVAQNELSIAVILLCDALIEVLIRVLSL